MAKNNNLTDFLTDVADAIRAKKGTTGKINPQDFSSEIASIEGGGDDVLPVASVNDVVLYNHNGDILYSYSKDEFLSLDNLPTLPNRDGLSFIGWTHDLDNAKEYVSAFGVLNIGACKVTDNGRTKIFFDVISNQNRTRRAMYTTTMVKGVTLYFGDGEVGSNGSAGNKYWTKRYEKKGSYVWEMEADENSEFGLGQTVASNSQKYACFGYLRDQENLFYGAGLRKIHCGNNISFYHHFFCNNFPEMEEISLSLSESKELSEYSFERCGIRCCVIPKGMEKIGAYCFSQCGKLVSVILPNTITHIDAYAFKECESLRMITLPPIETIDYGCFSGCYNLEVVTVPNTVTQIFSDAFRDCVSLRLVDFSQHNKVPSLGTYEGFSNTPLVKILVPDALYDEWITSDNWSSHASKIVKVSEYNA